LQVIFFMGTRERASTLSSSGRAYRARCGGLSLVVALAGPGCTLTASEFEPNQVGSTETETGSLIGSEPPAALPQAPADSTTTPPLTSEETEGTDPNVAREPTAIGSENAGGAYSGSGGPDARADAGVAPREVDEPSTPDSSAPLPLDASVPPPSEAPPDASAARTDPPPQGSL
jgi:hypothetical protein